MKTISRIVDELPVTREGLEAYIKYATKESARLSKLITEAKMRLDAIPTGRQQ
jgi:hypothetical protein